MNDPFSRHFGSSSILKIDSELMTVARIQAGALQARATPLDFDRLFFFLFRFVSCRMLQNKAHSMRWYASKTLKLPWLLKPALDTSPYWTSFLNFRAHNLLRPPPPSSIKNTGSAPWMKQASGTIVIIMRDTPWAVGPHYYCLLYRRDFICK